MLPTLNSMMPLLTLYPYLITASLFLSFPSSYLYPHASRDIEPKQCIYIYDICAHNYHSGCLTHQYAIFVLDPF